MRMGRSDNRIKQQRKQEKRMSSAPPSQAIIFFIFDSNSTKKYETGSLKKIPVAAVLSMEGYTCQNDVMFVS